jgi:ubiquinone/menaquinone biosynthesis C-methylase UbiE
MEASRSAAHSISSSSAYSAGSREDVHSTASAANPLTTRYGRRYLRNVPYPLPVDLPELQRQNLGTLLATNVLGKAVGSPLTEKHPPRTVLEIACGSGFWSAQCHDYLSELGCLNVSFTGLDIVNLAPNFRAHGINWRFVQHDLRKIPLPFEDESFDLIVLKDLSLVLQIGQPQQRILDEAIRVLRAGGVLEIWETDHIIRSLCPHPPPPPGKNANEHRQALLTGTFLISAATPFVPAKNKYLQDCNAWIQRALDKRKLSPAPCAGMLPLLLQEPEALSEVGGRRVAIPFGEMHWEQEDAMLVAGRELAVTSAGIESAGKGLTAEQTSVRSTALQVLVQFIESMEPLLKEVSGKNGEEWQRFWGMMMADLFEDGGANNGDCLELGVYWARKR